MMVSMARIQKRARVRAGDDLTFKYGSRFSARTLRWPIQQFKKGCTLTVS